MRRFLIAFCLTWGVALASDSTDGGRLYQTSISAPMPATGIRKPAPGRFLVASRSLDDPRFIQSVVYLVKHSGRGTLGLIVNRPGSVSLLEAIPGIEDKNAGLHTLYYGGPVGQTVIFMLLRGEPEKEGIAHVAGEISFSSSRQVLDRMLVSGKPSNEVHFHIGHSGWAPGQLRFEIVHGSWHVVDANADAIFSGDVDLLWARLIEELEPLGIQANN